jgi:hypothetical protein
MLAENSKSATEKIRSEWPIWNHKTLSDNFVSQISNCHSLMPIAPPFSLPSAFATSHSIFAIWPTNPSLNRSMTFHFSFSLYCRAVNPLASLQAELRDLRFVILPSLFGSPIHHQIHSSRYAIGHWPFAANSRAFSPGPTHILPESHDWMLMVDVGDSLCVFLSTNSIHAH